MRSEEFVEWMRAWESTTTIGRVSNGRHTYEKYILLCAFPASGLKAFWKYESVFADSFLRSGSEGVLSSESSTPAWGSKWFFARAQTISASIMIVSYVVWDIGHKHTVNGRWD